MTEAGQSQDRISAATEDVFLRSQTNLAAVLSIWLELKLKYFCYASLLHLESKFCRRGLSGVLLLPC